MNKTMRRWRAFTIRSAIHLESIHETRKPEAGNTREEGCPTKNGKIDLECELGQRNDPQ